MINYYVKTDGNDSDTGLDWDHAWLTIAHAQANVAVGDGQWYQDNDPTYITNLKSDAVNMFGSLKWFYLDDDSGGGGSWHGLFNVIYIAAGTYNETSAFVFDPPAWTRWEGAGSSSTNLFMQSYNNPSTLSNDYIGIAKSKLGTGVSAYLDIGINTDNFFIDCYMGCWMSCGWVINGDRTNLYFNNCSVEDDVWVFDFENGSSCRSINGTFDNISWADNNVNGYFNLGGTGNTFTNCFIGNGTGESEIYCTDLSMNNSHFNRVKLWGSSSNVVSNCDFVGTGFDYLTVLKDASADGQQLFTDCFVSKCTVASGAQLICDWTDRKFYETSNSLYTTVTTAKTQLVIAGGSSNITFTERPLLITTNANISVLVDTWSVAGDKNKAWKVEATGSRTITFQLGDMLPDTDYDLKVGGVKVSDATSNGSGVVTFSPYSGSFSEKEFGAEKSPEVTFVSRIIIT